MLGSPAMCQCPAPPCEILPWDSDFFGFRVARVRADTLNPEAVGEVDCFCAANEVTCLYFLARADDPVTTLTAERADFHLVDIRVTLRLDHPASAGQSERVAASTTSFRQANRHDLPALQEIAGSVYQDTRFYYDYHFPRRLARALYVTWIVNSCTKGYADIVFVAERRQEIVGYISCQLRDQGQAGTIGLVGVSRAFRGDGLGCGLVATALAWFKEQGVTQVSVVTQGRNEAAQRVYQRCGFVTSQVRLWYHKWYRLLEEDHG